MSLPIFNQPCAIDLHPTDFWGFETTPDVRHYQIPKENKTIKDGDDSGVFNVVKRNL